MLRPAALAALALIVAALAVFACGPRAPGSRPEGGAPSPRARGGSPSAPASTAPAQTPAVGAPAPSPPVVATPAQPRPDLLLARAKALRAEGNVAGAVDRLEGALEVAPTDDQVRMELADILLADGRELARAEALLAGVSARGPRVHLLLARLAEARGDDGGAALEYELALADADDADARLRRALILQRLGRAAEAIGELERARTARPNDVLARARLASLYESTGRIGQAEAELRALADADPDRAAHWERLARFYERVGRRSDARAALERARLVAGRNDRALRPLLPSRQ